MYAFCFHGQVQLVVLQGRTVVYMKKGGVV